MARIRERVVNVWLPVLPDSGGSGIGVVRGMATLLAGVVLVGLLVMIAVTVQFPPHKYGTAPVTRQLGPCEPFCSLRTTTVAPAPVGGEQR
ncbi:hypothetical protein [Nocardia sp. CA-120079]|uniref:hypothetical protein n=1 Tax=Nocardia sp. CA-120079 TaxID=3239974 RepID=UPI003D96B327